MEAGGAGRVLWRERLLLAAAPGVAQLAALPAAPLQSCGDRLGFSLLLCAETVSTGPDCLTLKLFGSLHFGMEAIWHIHYMHSMLLVAVVKLKPSFVHHMPTSSL